MLGIFEVHYRVHPFQICINWRKRNFRKSFLFPSPSKGGRIIWRMSEMAYTQLRSPSSVKRGWKVIGGRQRSGGWMRCSPLLFCKFHSGHVVQGSAFRVFRTDSFSLVKLKNVSIMQCSGLLATLIFHTTSKGQLKVSEQDCLNPVVCSPVSSHLMRSGKNTYLLTYSMQQSPSWESNRFSASQEIPSILCNPKIHYRSHKRQPPVPILTQIDPAHAPTPYFLKIHLNIIIPSMPGSYKWSLTLRFPHQNLKCTSTLPDTCYMLRPSLFSILSVEKYLVRSIDN